MLGASVLRANRLGPFIMMPARGRKGVHCCLRLLLHAGDAATTAAHLQFQLLVFHCSHMAALYVCGLWLAPRPAASAMLHVRDAGAARGHAGAARPHGSSQVSWGAQERIKCSVPHDHAIPCGHERCAPAGAMPEHACRLLLSGPWPA